MASKAKNIKNYINWTTVNTWQSVNNAVAYRGMCSILCAATYGYSKLISVCVTMEGTLSYRYEGNYYLTIKQCKKLAERFWLDDNNREDISARAAAIKEYYESAKKYCRSEIWKTVGAAVVAAAGVLGTVFTAGTSAAISVAAIGAATGAASSFIKSPSMSSAANFISAMRGDWATSHVVVWYDSDKKYYFLSQFSISNDDKLSLKDNQKSLSYVTVDGLKYFSSDGVHYFDGVSTSSANTDLAKADTYVMKNGKLVLSANDDSGLVAAAQSGDAVAAKQISSVTASAISSHQDIEKVSSVKPIVEGKEAGLSKWQKWLLISCAGGVLLSGLLKEE